MANNKEAFTVKIDGADVELAIVKPSQQDQSEGQKIYNRTWAEAVSSKSPVRAVIPDILKEQGLWTDEDNVKFEELGKEVLSVEKKLKGGAKYYDNDLSKAREDAVALRTKRNELNNLLMKRSVLDNHTAEGQAEIAKLNYLIYACTVYNKDGKRYFKNMDDYDAKSDSEVAALAASKFMSFVNGVDYDFEKKYAENDFLLRYGFINDKLQLVNSDGKAVDSKGNLINEFGQRIDESGNILNINNDPINEDGSFTETFVDFTDENGEVIKTKQ